MGTGIAEAVGRLIKRAGSVEAVVKELEVAEAREQADGRQQRWEAAVKRLPEVRRELDRTAELEERYEQAVSVLKHWNDRGRLEHENQLRDAVQSADQARTNARSPLEEERRTLLKLIEESCPFQPLIQQALEDLKAMDQEALSSGDIQPKRLSGSDMGGSLNVGAVYVSRRPSMRRRRVAIAGARSEIKKLVREPLTWQEVKARIPRIMEGLPPLRDEVFEVTPRGENKFLRVATRKDLGTAA